MAKYFQVFVDLENEDQALPMRIREDQIQGFRKYTEKSCILFTTFGKYRINEDYEHLSSRFFGFVNNGPEESETGEIQTTPPARKKYLVRQRVRTSVENYYDHNQPDTNCQFVCGRSKKGSGREISRVFIFFQNLPGPVLSLQSSLFSSNLESNVCNVLAISPKHIKHLLILLIKLETPLTTLTVSFSTFCCFSAF